MWSVVPASPSVAASVHAGRHSSIGTMTEWFARPVLHVSSVMHDAFADNPLENQTVSRFSRPTLRLA
jgi:hypothetical protein